MYLSRLTLHESLIARNWVANAYRVHQRVTKACDNRGRTLFRVEESEATAAKILVQSEVAPAWDVAFHDLDVLAGPPETKAFDLRLISGVGYAFRLLANPTVCRDGRRLGVLKEANQRAWVTRKLAAAGAEPLDMTVRDMGFIRSHRGQAGSSQTHLAVLYEGELHCTNADALVASVKSGIGAAKGFGFGLLSLARL